MNKVTAIVAVTKNLGIGCGNQLLVKSSAEMAFFSGFTQGKCLLVGYNTHSTLHKLVGREVVLDSCKLTSMDLKRLMHGCTLSEVVVIGGAKTYAKYADQVEELYITFFKDEGVGADTFFPIDAYEHLDNRVTVFRSKKGDEQQFSIEKWS
jgi:dihydrofolate reductase